MRRRHLGIGGGLAGLAVLGLLVSWWLTRAPRLGLERPRIVLIAGEVTVDGARARPAQPFGVGATLRTLHGGVCFSLRASRVCMGTSSDAVLTELDGASATILAARGAFVASSSGDELRFPLPLGAGAVVLRVGVAAIEELGSPSPTVRALEGSVTLQSSGRPDVMIAAPDAVDQVDGKKRPPAPSLEAEESALVRLAGSWEGTAGAIIEVAGLHGRVEVDGTQVGLAPASILVEEGRHTLVVRDSGRETMHETLKLSAGETVVRGG